MAELLSVKGVVAGYGSGPAILNGSDLSVEPGKIHCIIGPNGAGKSTLLQAIVGILKPREGEVMFQGERLNGLRPDQVLRRGIAFVPQERALFPKMSVRENLRMGGFILNDRVELQRRIDEVLERFPILKERADQHAGTMSGGQQQTLSMARAMLLRPKIVMLDEPSLGLAPKIVQDMFDLMKMLRDAGATILLVVHNALMGLTYSDWGLALDLCLTLLERPSQEILTEPSIQ